VTFVVPTQVGTALGIPPAEIPAFAGMTKPPVVPTQVGTALGTLPAEIPAFAGMTERRDDGAPG
jgi:hypothetical protein